MLKSDRFRRWFGYSRRERQGTYILSLILVVVLIARIAGLMSPGSHPLAEIIPETEENAPAILFPFDPNNAGIDDLVLLGLSQRQATTLENYRKAGGKFRKPEDFKKVYGIDSALQERLIPYINIDESAGGDMEYGSRYFVSGSNSGGISNRVSSSNRVSGSRNRGSSITGGSNRNSGSRIGDASKGSASGETESVDRNYGTDGNNPLRIELNSADSFLLKSLPGIGNVLSSRIVRYRNLLGGFVTVDQLGEVYGIDSLLVAELEPLLFTDTTLVRTIDINRAGYGDLLRHPYISETEVSLIIRYRNMVGVIESISELLVNRLIEPVRYRRVYPYLTIMNDSILMPS